MAILPPDRRDCLLEGWQALSKSAPAGRSICRPRQGGIGRNGQGTAKTLYVLRALLRAATEADLDTVVNQGVQSGYFCIEIADSVMYAMDYPPVVWISGRSGWFELKPSRQYEEMYSQMCEAITLYYEIRAVFQSYEASVADYRRKPKSERKRIREPTINLDDVLLEVDTPPIFPVYLSLC